MSRNIDLTKATVGSPTACSIALVELIRTMEQIDAAYNSFTIPDGPTKEQDAMIDKLEDRREALEAQIRREIADKLHIDAAILQEAVTFI